MDEQQIQQVEANVQALVDQFGHFKVNLLRPGEPNEGVWVTAVNQESADKCRDDNSSGEQVEVVLCNQPLGWGNFRWGQRVIAETRGDTRPVASLAMQSGTEGEWA